MKKVDLEWLSYLKWEKLDLKHIVKTLKYK